MLKWASLLIAALGGSGNGVIPRNPALPKWRDGLAACDVVAADVLAAAELPKQIRPIVLRVIPDSFLEEIRRLVTVENRNRRRVISGRARAYCRYEKRASCRGAPAGWMHRNSPGGREDPL